MVGYLSCVRMAITVCLEWRRGGLWLTGGGREGRNLLSVEREREKSGQVQTGSWWEQGGYVAGLMG